MTGSRVENVVNDGGCNTGGNFGLTWTTVISDGSWITKTKYDITDFKPEHVTFNDKTTVVFWKDKTKTIVTCGEHDVFDPEHGVAMAIAHKMFGSKNQFKKFVKTKSYTSLSKELREKRKELAKLKKNLQEKSNTE